VAEAERIAIVGLGLIGGSLALALRRALPGLRIIGVDDDPRPREQALEERAVDAATAPEDAPLDVCDLVVLATPAQALLTMLPKVAARMRPGAVLTDVCGAKELICAAGAAQDRVAFVGGHPMAGTEYRGFVAATPALFDGCTVALCPSVGAPVEGAAAKVRALWTSAGAEKILDVDAAVHDRAVTFASHLPYLGAAAVVDALLAAGDVGHLARELAAGGFRDTTRLAGDGTLGGAAALNRFMPQAARALAERLRLFAAQLENDPFVILQRLSELSEERRQMRMPAVTPTSSVPGVPIRRR